MTFSWHTILPPYMLQEIAQRGTGSERAEAIQTLQMDQTFRIQRIAQSQGTLLRTMSALQVGPEKQRIISTANNAMLFPGEILRREGDPPSDDPVVNEAYDGLGATFDLFWNVYARNSIDGAGLPLNATIHYGSAYANAFWNGERMVFGDGDGKLFTRFTGAFDIIGHELAHGVTQYEARLRYANQAGALNESLSDVFGSLVKQYARQQTVEQADWLIGTGLFTNQVQGIALRSLKAPGSAYDDPVLGKDPQPAHMSQFIRTTNDNGGVHINSGIPNHAFYLLAMALGGYAWERAGKIWYETLRDNKLRQTSGFLAFARLTVAQASRLYGEQSDVLQAVREAWQQVGIQTN